jgi:hypothetical protein
MAKSTPYLVCHRDNFPAKVSGPVAGWLRQVAQPPFIAGPLVVIAKKAMFCHLDNYITVTTFRPLNDFS